MLQVQTISRKDWKKNMGKKDRQPVPNKEAWLQHLRDNSEDVRGFLGMEQEQFDVFLNTILDENGNIIPGQEDKEEELLKLMTLHEGFLTRQKLPGGGFLKNWGLIKISRRKIRD